MFSGILLFPFIVLLWCALGLMVIIIFIDVIYYYCYYYYYY